jgi:hypothetical protein
MNDVETNRVDTRTPNRNNPARQTNTTTTTTMLIKSIMVCDKIAMMTCGMHHSLLCKGC